ncbi:MAG: protein translocase subunit SecD [Candidatus Peregrinibacteria bacterium]|nr:protein translocase subunit SecD [Candidatus Peregrinibacteria bacterium]
MKRFSKGLVSIIIATVFMSLVALPNSVKSQLPSDPVSKWIKKQKITLGLDLQGGTQLDYRIDLRNIEARNADEDPSNDVTIRDIVEGVRATLERRVNGLGVSEPNIYTSDVAGEKHIIVELAGIKDVDEAKAIVGKTIQLEFKEPKTEEDPELIGKIEAEAKQTLQSALGSPENFDSLASGIQTSDGKVAYRSAKESFASSLPTHYKNVLPGMQIGQVHDSLLENSGDFMISEGGQITQRTGFLIVKLEAKETRDKVERTEEKVRASHILISYVGAERANPEVTRTKDEAREEAMNILEEVKADPENFADFAKQYSDGPTGANGGDLDFFEKGVMAPAFEESAFSMAVDQVSELVETSFGFHIIKVTDKQEAEETSTSEEFYTFSEILYDTTPDPWQATGLDGANFKYASATTDQFGSPQVAIQFDNEGALKFEELTERLTGQRLAIFVGGELISAPTVNQKIVGGQAVITGIGNLQDALALATDLNTGAIDAPVLLSGQYTISASLGEDALSLSLYAGILGLIALAIFMLLYYRLMGVFAVIALMIYSVIIIFILKTTGIVMTLAGIAGIILSIGMAVDANILIFERSKEELAEGNSYIAAMHTGFERAWSSIRDSNVSSLITCVILWFFGNSIIRGFALMLGIGILVSMFTAITITRTLLQTLNGTRASKSKFLLGAKR